MPKRFGDKKAAWALAQRVVRGDAIDPLDPQYGGEVWAMAHVSALGVAGAWHGVMLRKGVAAHVAAGKLRIWRDRIAAVFEWPVAS